MNLTDITRSAIILTTYSIVPMTDNKQTLINYNYSQPIENNNILNLFQENKIKLTINDIIKPKAFNKYKEALNVIFQSEENYKIGVEFTKNNTIFITSLFNDIDAELHLELYFNDEERNTFFSIYSGNDMIDTGIYTLDIVKSKIKKSLEQISEHKLLIPA